MKLSHHSFNLPLAHTFKISRGEGVDYAKTLIIELEHQGVSGYGEAGANSYYKNTVEEMVDVLNSHKTKIESMDPNEPENMWNALKDLLNDYSFVLCGLDMAAHDLYGKLKNRPLYELWGLDPSNNVCSNYTIGISTIDVMVEKMKEFPDWPIYKIKLGTSEDVTIVRELRKHTDAVFRVDANCAWTAQECLKNAEALVDLNVEYIEQPLKANDWEGMKIVFDKSPLPVIADESCIKENDVGRCHSFFHGINIKLGKCGGLTPARRMIKRARELDMSVMMGCMVESTIAISAIAQLLPMLDYVDMDGALLLKEDIATGVRIEKGVCIYSGFPGAGARLL